VSVGIISGEWGNQGFRPPLPVYHHWNCLFRPSQNNLSIQKCVFLPFSLYGNESFQHIQRFFLEVWAFSGQWVGRESFETMSALIFKSCFSSFCLCKCLK
jgi:hypothetical protein